MGLTKGINCGFVTEAPVGDPGESGILCDNYQYALKDTAPVGENKITEIGWWCDNPTEESNFEVAIYDHNVGDDNPENIIGSDKTNAKGTGSGWKVVSGLNIPITAETLYWIAMQLDNTATATDIDYSMSGGEKMDRTGSIATLQDPWGATGNTYGALLAIYAVYEAEQEAVGEMSGSIRQQSCRGTEVPGIYP